MPRTMLGDYDIAQTLLLVGKGDTPPKPYHTSPVWHTSLKSFLWWFCGVVVRHRIHDFWSRVRIPAMTLLGSFFLGKLSWNVTTTKVNSALHPSGVAKSSTSFSWGEGEKVCCLVAGAGNTV